MGSLGAPELLLVLAIILLLFGVGRVSNLAGELGKAVRNFREGMEGREPPNTSQDETDTTK